MTEKRPLTESELLDRVRSVDVRAPQGLHDRIEQMIAEHAHPGAHGDGRHSSTQAKPVFGRRLAAGLALAAVVIAVLVVALSSGGDGGAQSLTVNTASALTLRPATAAAPHEDHSSGGTELAAAVDGVPYPYWADRFGWRSTGSRIDRIGGRTVRTVFYANARGQRVGYAIVAGTPARRTGSGVVVWRDGTAYRLMGTGEVRVVTWLRHGHTCVVAGHGVSSATLLTLASWDDHDRTAA
jgi:hypothetical protein